MSGSLGEGLDLQDEGRLYLVERQPGPLVSAVTFHGKQTNKQTVAVVPGPC